MEIAKRIFFCHECGKVIFRKQRYHEHGSGAFFGRCYEKLYEYRLLGLK